MGTDKWFLDILRCFLSGANACTPKQTSLKIDDTSLDSPPPRAVGATGRGAGQSSFESEVFAYYLFGGSNSSAGGLDRGGWASTVDWSVITTVASIHSPPDVLIQAAHKHGRKVVLSVDPGRSAWFRYNNMSTELQNATARREWADGLASYVRLRSE